MSSNVVESLFDVLSPIFLPSTTKDDIEIFDQLEKMFKDDDFDCSKETDTKKLFCYGVYLHLCNNVDVKIPFLIGSNLGCGYCSNFLGMCYDDVSDYGSAKYFYKKAIEKGLYNGMHNLAFYYKDVEKDYEKMKKYFEMAIEKGSVESMYSLALYYKNISKDYKKMKKYLEMAIEKGDVESMYSLADYYKNIKDYEMMIYYLEMAVEKGCEISMNKLCKYYTSKDCENEIEALQFFYKHNKMNYWIKNLKYNLELCNDHNFGKLIDYLVTLHKANDDKYNQIKNKIPYLTHKLIEIASKNIDTLELHFKYSPSAEGFEEAKKDFFSLKQK